jgi:hypothetical protein
MPTKDLFRYEKDPADPTIERANPLLEQVRSTQTRFKAPYAQTYLTFENIGEYDRRIGTVAFRDVPGQPEGLVLPPENRVVIGQKLADGTTVMKEVELPYGAELSAITPEIRAVASSFRAALPEEIAVALRRLGPRL